MAFSSLCCLTAFTRICYCEVSTLHSGGYNETPCGANDLTGDSRLLTILLRNRSPGAGAWEVAYSEICNNVGPVKSFFCFFPHFCHFFSFSNTRLRSLRRVVLLVPFFDRCFDDLGSLIIFRSTSVRPKHLFDPYFEP